MPFVWTKCGSFVKAKSESSKCGPVSGQGEKREAKEEERSDCIFDTQCLHGGLLYYSSRR